MLTTDADLDKVLNYLAPKIDFRSDMPFEQDKDDMTDLLIDLKMNYEAFQNVLNFYERDNIIKDLIINDNGYKFLPWSRLHELWDEGGFEIQKKRAQ